MTRASSSLAAPKYLSYDSLREQVVGKTVTYPRGAGFGASHRSFEGVVIELLQTDGRYSLLIRVGDQYEVAGISVVEFK